MIMIVVVQLIWELIKILLIKEKKSFISNIKNKDKKDNNKNLNKKLTK